MWIYTGNELKVSSSERQLSGSYYFLFLMLLKMVINKQFEVGSISQGELVHDAIQN